MKSFSERDVKLSMQKGIWATQQRNESKLNAAYQVRSLPSAIEGEQGGSGRRQTLSFGLVVTSHSNQVGEGGSERVTIGDAYVGRD